jgi:hypothetical protein
MGEVMKRTDERDNERAMAQVKHDIDERMIERTVDAEMRQAYLDDPFSGAYDLPFLMELGGNEVIILGE